VIWWSLSPSPPRTRTPNDASKRFRKTSHFDVFKLRDGKIAERSD
jgi:hypothetical protein